MRVTPWLPGHTSQGFRLEPVQLPIDYNAISTNPRAIKSLKRVPFSWQHAETSPRRATHRNASHRPLSPLARAVQLAACARDAARRPPGVRVRMWPSWRGVPVTPLEAGACGSPRWRAQRARPPGGCAKQREQRGAALALPRWVARTSPAASALLRRRRWKPIVGVRAAQAQ